MKTYTGMILTPLLPNEVFVFGSNPEGIHGGGAAKTAALNCGAIYGQGRGHQGQSYGLVTKNLTPNFTEVETGINYPIAGVKSVTQSQIVENIRELYDYARANPDLDFMVAYTLSRNLNGYLPIEMITMFMEATIYPYPPNIIFNDQLINHYDEYKRNLTKEIT